MFNLKKWNLGLNLSLINSGIFFLASLLLFIFNPNQLPIILLIPCLFLFSSLYISFLFVRSGAILFPLTWFILGSGVYFGFGVLVGGLQVHPYTDKLFGSDYSYLINANLLNSSSVLIVLITIYIFQYFSKNKDNLNDKHLKKLENFLGYLYPYIVLVGMIGVVLHLLFFPIAENLLLRSMLSKISIFTTMSILVYGFLSFSTKSLTNYFALLVLFLAIFKGFIAFSKFEVISISLVFVIGVLIRKHSVKNIIIGFTSIFLVYVLINPMVVYGRASVEYKPNSNTIMDRVNIVSGLFLSYKNDSNIEVQPVELEVNEIITERNPSLDEAVIEEVIVTNSKDSSGMDLITTKTTKIVDEALETTTSISSTSFLNLRQHITLYNMVTAFAVRFDVASIQGYLINEYNVGRNGNSLDKFWVILIPRILWPEKPIMTDSGGELNSQYYGGGTGTELSAIAPTYTAEAYWNYGVIGVLLISIYLGVIIGWFTNLAYRFLNNNEPVYLLIAFPAILTFAHLESWIVSTFIGGFGILVVIFLIFKLLLLAANKVKS